MRNKKMYLVFNQDTDQEKSTTPVVLLKYFFRFAEGDCLLNKSTREVLPLL